MRCAFMYVASINTTFCRPPSEASPHHLDKDPHVAPPPPSAVEGFGGPYSQSASRRRNPLWLMKIMPLKTRRSSTRSLRSQAQLFERNGLSRSICASVSRERLIILIPISLEA